MSLQIIVLAAGQGTRMRSAHPKVLQPLAGQPLLAHVLATARSLSPDGLHVVYGHGGEAVRAAFPDADLNWVEQAEQLGTGHAVQLALPSLPDDATALILYGDVPLTPVDTLQALLNAAEVGLAVLSVELDDPTGYGRILRDERGQVCGIVEHKDATAAERAIREVNTGLIAAPADRLREWTAKLGNDNAQGEFYLTDCIAMAVADGLGVVGVSADCETDVLGVNDRRQLAVVERALQARHAEALMAAGVTLLDPRRIDVRGALRTGRDCIIDANVVFEGEVELGDGVRIASGSVIRDSRLGDGVVVHPNTVVEGAVMAADCAVGPFARIRPGTELASGVKVGNFVEMKKARLGAGSKASHLSYIGDAEIGAEVNIGAGTITCNYDGVNKSTTTIGDGAFIGSNTALVAPVKVGREATVGAGSTITKDVPDGELAVARGRQTTVRGWRKPKKCAE